AEGDTFSTPVQIYDSLGAPHVATITYTKTATAGAWDYVISVPGGEISGGTPGTPFPIPGGSGTVTFDASGVLTQVNGAAPADMAITTPAWSNGAAASTWTWDIVGDNDEPALTGFMAASATSAISQNGSAAGMIDNIT